MYTLFVMRDQTDAEELDKYQRDTLNECIKLAEELEEGAQPCWIEDDNDEIVYDFLH